MTNLQAQKMQELGKL